MSVVDRIVLNVSFFELISKIAAEFLNRSTTSVLQDKDFINIGGIIAKKNAVYHQTLKVAEVKYCKVNLLVL